MSLIHNANKLRLFKGKVKPNYRPFKDNTTGVRAADVDNVVEKIYEELEGIDSSIASLTAPGITNHVDVTLTQAEVRSLSSANGGYGYKFLDAPGADKIYVITSNPVYYWNVTGGTVAASDIWLYNASTTAQYFTSSPSSALVPFTLYNIPNVYNTETDAGTDGLAPGNNDPLYMYASVEMSAYEGTLRVQFDYKVIDFS